MTRLCTSCRKPGHTKTTCPDRSASVAAPVASVASVAAPVASVASVAAPVASVAAPASAVDVQELKEQVAMLTKMFASASVAPPASVAIAAPVPVLAPVQHWPCKLCGIERMLDEKQWQEHMTGKKHKMNVEAAARRPAVREVEDDSRSSTSSSLWEDPTNLKYILNTLMTKLYTKSENAIVFEQLKTMYSWKPEAFQIQGTLHNSAGSQPYFSLHIYKDGSVNGYDTMHVYGDYAHKHFVISKVSLRYKIAGTKVEMWWEIPPLRKPTPGGFGDI